MKRALVVINPISGAGRVDAGGSSEVDVARRALAVGGFDATVVVTTGPGHASEATRHACAQGAELVVAWGGDGTMNEVARVLAFGAGAVGPGARRIGQRPGARPRRAARSAGRPGRGRRRPPVADRRRGRERGAVLQRGRARSRRPHRSRVRRAGGAGAACGATSRSPRRSWRATRRATTTSRGRAGTPRRGPCSSRSPTHASTAATGASRRAPCSTTAGSTSWWWTTCRCGGCWHACPASFAARCSRAAAWPCTRSRRARVATPLRWELHLDGEPSAGSEVLDVQVHPGALTVIAPPDSTTPRAVSH